MLAALRPEPVREAQEVLLVDRVEHFHQRPLDDLVFERRNPQRPHAAVCFRDVLTPGRCRPVGVAVDAPVQLHEPFLQSLAVLLPCDAVYSGRRLPMKPEVRLPEQFDIDKVHQRGELLLLPLPCGLSHALQPLEHALPALRPARA